MKKLKKMTAAAVVMIVVLVAAAWFAAAREIRKESKLAELLELPYRTASWTLAEQGMRPYQIPDELQALKQDLPEEKFNQISARISLRELNIQALRKAALETENSENDEQFVTPYSGRTSVAIVADDGTEAARSNIRSLVHALPAGIDILLVQSADAAKRQSAGVNRYPRKILTTVADELPRNGEAQEAPAADLADAIYNLRSGARRTLGYTLFLHHGTDLSWPDTAFIDKAAEKIGAKAVRVPITAAATDFLLGVGNQQDLFVSQKAIETELAKRDHLLLGITNRSNLMTSYREIFGAKVAWEIALGPGFNHLNSMVKIVGDKRALIIDSKGLDSDLAPEDKAALESCYQQLIGAGYAVTPIPASAEDIKRGRSPISGLLIAQGPHEKVTLLVPVKPDATTIDRGTSNALIAAGLNPVPVPYQAANGTTLGQAVALLQ